MHRATQLNIALRSFTAGGARSVVHQADDSKLMQEMGGSMMSGESRQRVESPQNYGFTSVVMDADQDGKKGAETFISFMGGGRSIPVSGPMDDRRHRLKGLEKGDVAMFRTKDDGLQMHMNQDGGFFSGPNDKNVRMQLVQKPQQQQGQSGSSGSSGSSGGAGGAGGGAGSQYGQKPIYKNGQDTDFFFHLDQTNGAIASGLNVYLRQGSSFGSSSSSSSSSSSGGGGGGASKATSSGGSSSSSGGGFTPKTDNVKVHIADDGNVYLGGKKGDSGMLRVLLEGELISQNVYAKSGGGSEPPDPQRAGAASTLLPVLTLLLGLSIGINYAFVSDAWRSVAIMIASR
jgi:phage gp45-like